MGHVDTAQTSGAGLRGPAGVLGLDDPVVVDRQYDPSAYRHVHADLARRPMRKDPAMGSLFTMLTAREADARVHAEDLRAQIAKLAEQLDAAETELSRLAITRAAALA